MAIEKSKRVRKKWKLSQFIVLACCNNYVDHFDLGPIKRNPVRTKANFDLYGFSFLWAVSGFLILAQKITLSIKLQDVG